VEQVAGKVIQKNTAFLKFSAQEYYYNISIPILGILIQNSIQCDDVSDLFLRKLMNQEIDGFVDDALTENEHFTNYVMLLQRIDEFAKEMKSDKNTMYEYAFARPHASSLSPYTTTPATMDLPSSAISARKPSLSSTDCATPTQ
jgi:hypothetical protein